MNVDHLVTSLGYWAVFLLVAAESLGVPLPGETAVIVAGAYAGQSHHLNPWVIFAVAAAAAIVGDNAGYWVGDKGGYRLMGIDHLVHALGEAGSEPPAGEHFCRLGAVSLRLDRAPVGR